MKLNPAQSKLFERVKQYPGSTVADLASAVRETRCSTRNILYRLVEKGLVVKRHVRQKVYGFNDKPHISMVNVYQIKE